MYFFIFFMQRCYDGQNAHTTSMHIYIMRIICAHADMRMNRLSSLSLFTWSPTLILW